MSRTIGRHRLVIACALLGFVALSPPALAQGNTQDPEMACIQRCSLVPDAFGTKKPDPACVKKCLLSGGAERAPELPRIPPIVPPRSAKAATSGIRFTPAWETSDARKKQKLVMESLVSTLPSGTAANATLVASLKRWMLQRVTFHRTSIPTSPGIPGAEMRARPGQLEFEDRFFTVSRGRQQSLITFELGKVLWVSVDATALVKITRVLDANDSVIMSLKRTPYLGADLGDLSDGADSASPLGYAVRALMLGLEPVDPAARATWRRIRPDLEREIAALLAR